MLSNGKIVLLILCILVILYTCNQRVNRVVQNTLAPLTSSVPLTGSFTESFTTTPNKLLSTDANGNLSAIPVSSVLPTSFFDYYNPFAGDVTKPQLGNIYNISSPDKSDLTLSSQKNVILLPGAGAGYVAVSKSFGGTGNFLVEGTSELRGDVQFNSNAYIKGDVTVNGIINCTNNKLMVNGSDIVARLAAVEASLSKITDGKGNLTLVNGSSNGQSVNGELVVSSQGAKIFGVGNSIRLLKGQGTGYQDI